MLSLAEENYLKAIYHLSGSGAREVFTNDLAEAMSTKAASVTDMMKKLSAKKLITYKKYHGVTTTARGRQAALRIIRKHRLWETFLVEKLKFNWDEVHDIAEQLEHIQSPILVDRLDEFLGFPKVDPHGDPIPDRKGHVDASPSIPMSKMDVGHCGTLIAVGTDDSRLLQFLDKSNLKLGMEIKVTNKLNLDGSMEIETDREATVFVSSKVAEMLRIQKENNPDKP